MGSEKVLENFLRGSWKILDFFAGKRVGTLNCCVLCLYRVLQRQLEEEAKKPAEERTSEPDVVVDMKNQSLVQTIHIDNRVLYCH